MLLSMSCQTGPQFTSAENGSNNAEISDIAVAARCETKACTNDCCNGATLVWSAFLRSEICLDRIFSAQQKNLKIGSLTFKESRIRARCKLDDMAAPDIVVHFLLCSRRSSSSAGPGSFDLLLATTILEPKRSENTATKMCEPRSSKASKLSMLPHLPLTALSGTVFAYNLPARSPNFSQVLL